MNHFDDLSLDVIAIIVMKSRRVFQTLALAYPRLGRVAYSDDFLRQLKVTTYSRRRFCKYDENSSRARDIIETPKRIKCMKTRLHGRLHSFDDKPASKDEFGDTCWYKYGRLHRDGDLPAYIDNDGSKYWIIRGETHRDNDMPAIITHDGCYHWYNHGIRSRKYGKANVEFSGEKIWYKFISEDTDSDGMTVNKYMITYEDGSKCYVKDEIFHRDDELPALINVEGDKIWYKDGELHRGYDLPAIVTPNVVDWAIEGYRYRETLYSLMTNDSYTKLDVARIMKRRYYVSMRKAGMRKSQHKKFIYEYYNSKS